MISRAGVRGEPAIPHVFTRRFLWAGYLMGFALGGFFDGILLHQILQWHHLLSALEAEPLRDLRAQVMADGAFHALMYVIGAIGLWLLYRARREFTDARADRNLLGSVLVGFGIWHVIDAILSHWTLGIHRIRMDVDNPLVWDLGWVAIFGLLPLFLGLLLKRQYPRETHIAERRGARAGLAVMLAALVIACGWVATLPPADSEGRATVTVVLRPGVQPGKFLAALQGSEARILWSDRAGGVWVLTAGEASRLRFYAYGALYVSGSFLPAGCSGWWSDMAT